MGTPFMNLSQGLTPGAPAQPGFPPRASGLTPEEYRELIRRMLMAQQTANVLPQQSPFMDLQTMLPQAQQLGAAMVPAPVPEPTTFRGRLAEGIRRGVAIPPEGMPGGTSQSLAFGLMQGMAGAQQARQQRIEEQRTLPARQTQAGMALMDWYKRMTARPAIGTLRPIIDEKGNVIYGTPEQALGQLVPQPPEKPPSEPVTRTALQTDPDTGETFAVTYDPTQIDPTTGQSKVVSRIRTQPSVTERTTTPEQRAALNKARLDAAQAAAQIRARTAQGADPRQIQQSVRTFLLAIGAFVDPIERMVDPMGAFLNAAELAGYSREEVSQYLSLLEPIAPTGARTPQPAAPTAPSPSAPAPTPRGEGPLNFTRSPK